MGYAVHKERLRRGWTQAELSERAGIGQSQVSVIENDPGKTRAATLLSVARAFQCDPVALFEGRIEPRAPTTLATGKPHRLELTLTAANLEKWIAYGEGLLASQPEPAPIIAALRRRVRGRH